MRLSCVESVAIMVAVVPVAFLMPAPLVLIPPPMMLAPASFPRFPQLASFVIRLPAMAPVMLNRFMQVVLGVLDPSLAPLIDFLARLRERSRRSR